MNSSNLLSFKSGHFAARSKELSQEVRRHRYSPHSSAIFAYEHQIGGVRGDVSKILSPQNMGVFSFNNCFVEGGKHLREGFENTRVSSFNIKKVLDRSVKKRLQAQTELRALNDHRELNRLLVKEYWQRFINSSSPFNDPNREVININKDMGVVVNRTKENKSESRDRTHLSFKQTSRRTTFYLNNFKTRYRRQKIESPPIKKEISLREKPLVERARKQLHPFGDSEVIPWEKGSNIEEQSFIGF